MWLVRFCHSPIALLLFLIAPCQAAGLEMAVTTWQSKGDTQWAHDATGLSNLLGNPTSRLSYKNVDSEIVEISLSLPFKSESLRFVIGSGIIGSGLLIDDDYVSAAGAAYYGTTASGAQRISRTNSDIRNSGLYYVNAEFYPEMFSFDIASMPLQLYAGLQYWKEDYSARGVRQIECTDSTGPPTFCNPVGFNDYNNLTVISNKMSWTTLYVGARTRLALSQSMSIDFMLNYSPFTYLSNEDTHHLRSDLRQDPSFSMTGFGQAIDLQLDWRYHFQDQVELSIGYRYWDRKVTNADWYSYSYTGTSAATLLDMHTTRKGLTLGLNMVF